MYIHNLSPIAFSLGPIDIRWYSLAYICALITGYYYLLFINRRFNLKIINHKSLEELIFKIIIGIIIGGRLGYVIFYNLSYYINHPSKIFFIWEGGMSFHGGLIGVTLAILYHSKKTAKSFFTYIDLVSCAVPIGLFLGRIANFINGELYGKITNNNWGVIFPYAGFLPRHPSQLYEAILEGLLAFIIMYFAVKNEKFRSSKGSLSGLFLIIYGISRILVEFYRTPDVHIGYFFNIITLGQILSLPMVLLGLYLIVFYDRKK